MHRLLAATIFFLDTGKENRTAGKNEAGQPEAVPLAAGWVNQAGPAGFSEGFPAISRGASGQKNTQAAKHSLCIGARDET